MDRCAEALGEHASSVQILCTYEEDGDSIILGEGSGNWSARVGMAKHMLDREVADINAQALHQIFNPPEEDNEQWKKKT